MEAKKRGRTLALRSCMTGSQHAGASALLFSLFSLSISLSVSCSLALSLAAVHVVVVSAVLVVVIVVVGFC